MNIPGMERVKHILSLLGGNAILLPIPDGVKKPTDKGWTSFTLQIMEDEHYLARFANNGNVGVCLGKQSAGLCTIDIDDDNYVEPFLKVNPQLRSTLRTKRLKGCNFWLWIDGEYPDVTILHHARIHNDKGKPLQIGEWRATGSQTVIEGQAGNIPYRRIVDAKPITIHFSDIIWPDWILNPPVLDEPFDNEPKSGNNLDLAKLEKLGTVLHYASGTIKCPCPACRENGEDVSGNHLQIKPNGKFGCAKYPKDKEHRKKIWALVGIPIKKDDPFYELNSSKPLPAKLTILTFTQIMELKRDDNDRILGNHLLDKGSPLVIAGQGGTGKSRLLFQFLAYSKMGLDKFLTFDLHPGCRELKWLIIQSENSPWRLQDEAKKYLRIMSEDAWSAFNASTFILTPLQEHDSMLALSDKDTVQRIKFALDDFKPDAVIADSLGDFSTGDLNKDADMRETILTLSRTIKHGNPLRSLIILHHALTGQAGASKAIGYDRSSFARNSKVLFNWTRAQINVAPMDENSNDQLSISCGKCSDGKEFQPFAIRLNPDSLLYECDPSVNVSEWSKSVKNHRMSPDIDEFGVQSLCSPAITKPKLAKVIIEEIGCSRVSAYRHIKRALLRKTITQNDQGALFKM